MSNVILTAIVRQRLLITYAWSLTDSRKAKLNISEGLCAHQKTSKRKNLTANAHGAR